MRWAAGIMLMVPASIVAVAAIAAERDYRASDGTRIVRADLPGRVVFEQNCAPCHGAGPGDDGSETLPGTGTLERKYGGTQPGELELRGNLPLPVIRLFVRRGVGAMPPFRKAELSEGDIVAIADYLADTAKASAAAKAP